MKNILLGLSIAIIGLSSSAIAQEYTAEELADAKAGMAAAKEMMKDPAYKQQLMEQVEAQGIDPAHIEAAMAPKQMDSKIDMASCVIDKLGQDGLNRIDSQNEVMRQEVRGLCAAGNASEAKKVALAHTKSMDSNSDYKIVSGCAKKNGVPDTLQQYKTMLRSGYVKVCDLYQ